MSIATTFFRERSSADGCVAIRPISAYSSRLFNEACPENCFKRAMWTPCATPLEIAPRRKLCGEGGAVEPGQAGPFVDDQRDRIMSIAALPTW